MTGSAAMDSGVMRILIAIDGSEPAALGLDLVAGVSWPADTEVVVAQAVETGTGLFGGAWPSVTMVQPDELEIAVEAQADQNVHRAAERLAASGLHVRPIVLRGRPATVVVDHARSLPADLVVVGSRGHGTIESMMLGSVSAEVVDHAHAPVLVTRSRQAKRIVLAWDGSPSATRAADVVATWPMFTAADVQVVTVAHAGVPWWTGFPEPGSAEIMPMYVEATEAARMEHEALAGQMAAHLQSAGVTAVPELREGDAATEILTAASASNADLIVIGTHGRTGLSRLILGSVARNVLQHARCSVLVVRGA